MQIKKLLFFLNTFYNKRCELISKCLALVNLGYNMAQAQKAVKGAMQACDGEPALAALITSALRYM